MERDVLMVDSVEQAGVLMKPARVALLRELSEPRTCPELARTFEETPQKMYYHVKVLERAGLVERCGERSVNGIAEGFYQARARSFWLSPRLVRRLGGSRTVRDQTSLRMLAGHAEELLEDVAKLADASASGGHVPSLSLAVDISLPPARRAEFLNELQSTFDDLARKYNASGDSEPDAESSASEADRSGAVSPLPATFRFALSCYPNPNREAS